MHVRESLGVSERRSCRVIGQHRSTQRKRRQEKVDEELLTGDIIKLAREYGRYGYRRIAVLLKNTGWQVNAKRVERIWRREGLKVPLKQPIRVDRKLNSQNVLDVLTDLFIIRGFPEYIRSDNGPEFVAKSVRNWISAVGAKTAYIEPGSPWENGYCESFNARLRDEFLNGEIFYTLKEAEILIEQWRVHYNTVRPHSSLNWNPPVPESLFQFDETIMIN